MEIEKNSRVNALLDFYHSLLTAKQDEYIKLYYTDDYSLGEIAEEFSVSRQAVYDNIKRTEKTLHDYEDKLHLYADFEKRSAAVDELRLWVVKKYPNDVKLQQLVDQIELYEG